MITLVAVAGYRSLRDVVVPLHGLDVVTGANGSGKSSLYRALRLLADCGSGRAIGSLAREGGLPSALWAGPESLDGARTRGYAVEGTRRRGPVSLRLGFATDDGFGYLVDLGLPIPGETEFNLDPEVKREMVFSGPVARPNAVLVSRKGRLVRTRDGRDWVELSRGLQPWESMLTELADPGRAPELLAVRDQIRAWRFYDGFRVDAEAPARRSQVGTRTPVLDHDGADLAAAVQTIREIGDRAALDHAVADAFDGATVEVAVAAGRFDLALRQPGMLRPLVSAELSDGTLRYLLLVAAAADATAAGADGAQRAGDQPAPRSAAAARAAGRTSRPGDPDRRRVALPDAPRRPLRRPRGGAGQGPRRDDGGRAASARGPAVALGLSLTPSTRAWT